MPGTDSICYLRNAFDQYVRDREFGNNLASRAVDITVNTVDNNDVALLWLGTRHAS